MAAKRYGPADGTARLALADYHQSRDELAGLPQTVTEKIPVTNTPNIFSYKAYVFVRHPELVQRFVKATKADVGGVGGHVVAAEEVKAVVAKFVLENNLYRGRPIYSSLIVTHTGDDVAVTGARPRWFCPVVLLPPGSTETEVEALFEGLRTATAAAGVTLVGGHTEVTSAVTRPIVVGQMLGLAEPGRLVPTGGLRPGDLVVQVGTAQEVVLNQTLSVAAAAEVVQVIETPVGVELSKASATIERKLDGRFVESVPLTAFFRDVNALAYMAPTATRAPGSTGISVSGQRARNNNFMIDGVDNNDLSVTLANARIIPEAVAEYQVQTASYSAEYGRNSGAQISVITRSGTNELHGSAWNYYRANWMEPVSLLNKRANILKTPRFVQNQAGGSLGGPIVRNRAFFFGLVETNRRREAADARNASPIVIPTPKGFADLRNVPLGPDQTPQSRQAMLDAISFLPEVYPLIPRYDNVTTTRVNGVPIEVGTARIPLANPADFWYVQSRVDYALSSRDNLSYRNHFDKRYQPDVVSNLGFGTRFSGAQTILSQNHALSHTRTFSPRFVNEFRAAYTRRNLDFPERDSRPTVGITGFFTIGGANNFPQGRIQNTFQWQNVSTFLLGRHSLKAGVDIRRNRLFNRASFDSKGTWTFNNLEDFMNNRAFSLVQAVNEATFDARQTNQYYFFQDDIRLTRDLTVNLGIRYEYSGVPFGFFGAANDQIAAVGVPLSITSGYSVPCTRKRGFGGSSLRASSSNTLTNSCPMVFLFFSGSTIPRSLPRNLSRASTTTNFIFM